MLMTTFRFSLLVLLLCCVAGPALSQSDTLAFYDTENVVICPATLTDRSPPNFASDACDTGSALDLDPQGDLVWMKTQVYLDTKSSPNGEPLSVYVSGKMSSDVYLNDVLIGQNGVPGDSKRTERPGKMDAEFHPPQSLLRVGENVIVLKASSHHGYIHLSQPLHLVGIAPSGIFSENVMRSVALPLVTLGLFLVGGLYFGVMAVISTTKIRFATLSAISVFAALQLVSETLRGLVQYDYPVHDLRLIAIAVFSAAFALSVAFHVFRTFAPSRVRSVMIGLVIASVLTMLLIKSMDYKALAGMVLPLLVSLAATGFWTYQRRDRAFVYFISILVFVASVFVFRGLFLDTVFFLLVAFFLMLLFVEQAVTLANEARQRRSEEARANRLAQALAEIGERTETQHIQIKSSGKLVRIATNQIVHCQGAGGYSEIILENGQVLLHSATLNELEETLPATFLRVHRSHLINVMFVKALKRDPSGTGTLSLSDQIEVPVSRRIMPKVREALS